MAEGTPRTIKERAGAQALAVVVLSGSTRLELFPISRTACLRKMRAAWFGSPTSVPKTTGMALLVGLSLAYLLLGWVALRYLEKKARAHGFEDF